MPKYYEVSVAEELITKINTFIEFEEKNLSLEKELYPDNPPNAFRAANIAAFKNVKEMVESHFSQNKIVNVSTPRPPRNNGARRPGRPSKAEKEAAAATESE